MTIPRLISYFIKDWLKIYPSPMFTIYFSNKVGKIFYFVTALKTIHWIVKFIFPVITHV